MAVLALGTVTVAVCGCGPGSCAAGSKMDRLVAQLQGDCCEFSTVPTDAQPDNSCKSNGPGPTLWMMDGERECVRWAAQCLGELGPDAAPAVPFLIAAVRSGPNNYDTGDGVIPVRDTIIEALGRTGDERALPVLIEVLENPRPVDAGPGAAGYASTEPVGEEAALTALRLLGPVARPAVPRILPFLNRPVTRDREARVVRAAAAALGAIGDTSAIPALIGALGREDTSPAVARALGEFGASASAALPALTRLIEAAPDRSSNGSIRQAIRDIGGKQRAAALPKSYDGTTADIVRLLHATAKRHGVRLTGIHVDGPNEEVSVETPSGTRVLARFNRQAWLEHRIVKGSVVVSRGGAVESSTPYEGLAQLESLLDRSLYP